MGGVLRGLKNIPVLLVWVVSAGLTSAAALAAPLPQNSGKQNDAAPRTSPGKTTLEEASKETSKETRGENYQFSTASHHGVHRLASDFFFDQKEIWTSPAKLRLSDTQWLFPLSGITAGLFVTDSDFSKHLS